MQAVILVLNLEFIIAKAVILQVIKQFYKMYLAQIIPMELVYPNAMMDILNKFQLPHLIIFTVNYVTVVV